MAEGIIGNRAAGLVILRMVALGWAFIRTFSGRAWEIPLFFVGVIPYVYIYGLRACALQAVLPPMLVQAV